MSDRPEFCHLCGLGFDSDPYEVVAEQMIDDSALGNDRVFTYFAYYHTHCVLEMYPRYLIENEAKAASAPIRPTGRLRRSGRFYPTGLSLGGRDR